MATKFGRVDPLETSFTEQPFNKNQTVTSASEGTHHYYAIQDHYLPGTTDAGGGLLSESGSHWAWVHTMFYSSGSTKISQSNPDEIDKFNSIHHGFNQYNDLKPYYNHKFYDTASVFYIPQGLFGERIQPGSFSLTARTGSYSNQDNQILIKDDGSGNLYSTNARHSQSSVGYNASIPVTNLSSSQNYVGNIIYDLGVAVLTETASWSGSVDYTDIGSKISHEEKNYDYWSMNFNSVTPIFTSQWSIKVTAGEFNRSMNASTKPYGHAEWTPSGSSIVDVNNTRTELLTGSFAPYITQIHLFRDQDEESVLVANLPRPIQVRDDIDLIITFRVDH